MSQLITENSSVPPDNLILLQAFRQHRGVNRGIWRAEFFGVRGEARTLPPYPPFAPSLTLPRKRGRDDAREREVGRGRHWDSAAANDRRRRNRAEGTARAVAAGASRP